MFIEILLIFIALSIIVLIGLIIRLNQNKSGEQVIQSLSNLEKNIIRVENSVREEIRSNRMEQAEFNTQTQQTIVKTLSEISTIQQKNLELQAQTTRQSIKELQESFTHNVKEFNDLQRQKFNDMALKQDELVKSTELKLEKMRETVDEKLHKTLEERLGQSFEIVSRQLQEVQKGLGEMQNLAAGVGDLKKVLSNVKIRGTLGEIQLANILEQILAPQQYEANVATKRGSADRVEFAIRFPGRTDDSEPVFLPIDAKFPQESYLELVNAYEMANPEAVTNAMKALEAVIKKSAKDIHDKYLDPPATTDFGIMFLPVEGLYAEVIRNTNLVEQLQRDYRIVVTGPTTLAAILNSLRMGFSTLAIEKRSGEIRQILGAVKSEFKQFGDILDKTQKKISEAGNELDRLVGQRTRAINRRLKDIEELPAGSEPLIIVGSPIDDTDENEV